MTNQVTVEIKGKQGAGKTTIFNLIVEALRKAGYDGETLPETNSIGEGAHFFQFGKAQVYDVIMVTRPAEKPITKAPKKKRTYKHWTTQQISFLRENFVMMSNKQLAEALGRSADSVTIKISELELFRPAGFQRLRKKEV